MYAGLLALYRREILRNATPAPSGVILERSEESGVASLEDDCGDSFLLSKTLLLLYKAVFKRQIFNI